MKTFRPPAQFVLGAITGAAVALIATAAVPQNAAQSLRDYADRLAAAPAHLDPAASRATRDFMERMMTAHHRRDAAAEIAELTEDYAFIKVAEDGPVTLAESRDMARQMTETLYQSDHMKNYLGVEATPIAVVGTIGIQLEVERFQFPNGAREQATNLSIYETRDGKLRRLWAFSPTSETQR